jgi:hypothetical protein
MPRIALDLNKEEDRRKVKGVWRRATGFIPGEPNQGLIAEVDGSSSRLPEYDDSGWEVCDNIRDRLSSGFAFAWWRIGVELPDTIDGQRVAGSTVVFEANIDDYGEIWVDGEIDLANGTIVGWNKQQRVVVSREAVPGTKHVIACLAANGPLARPFGSVWFRYAMLAFESNG